MAGPGNSFRDPCLANPVACPFAISSRVARPALIAGAEYRPGRALEMAVVRQRLSA